MKSAINSKRKIDAIISIRQDNTAKKITILNMNQAAEKILGCSALELIGKNFNMILPPRINEILGGYLDFSENSDFGTVARRIPNFQLVSKKGAVVSVSLKVFNLVGHDYELLLRDLTLINKIAELKQIIMSHPNEIDDKDPSTGLPSINNVVYAIDTAHTFIKQSTDIDVCFGLVEIGNYNYYLKTYGQYVAAEIIGTIGSFIRKCLRSEDVIGYMDDGVVGIVLIDCNLESAKMVFKRMKTKLESASITMQNGQKVTTSLAIAYTQIKKDRPMPPMISSCEHGLEEIRKRSGNGIVQV